MSILVGVGDKNLLLIVALVRGTVIALSGRLVRRQIYAKPNIEGLLRLCQLNVTVAFLSYWRLAEIQLV